jgi:hypothetical protein
LPLKIKNNLTRYLEVLKERPDPLSVKYHREQFEKTEKQYENFLQFKSYIAEKKESSLHGCRNMKAKGGCFGRRRKVVPI